MLAVVVSYNFPTPSIIQSAQNIVSEWSGTPFCFAMLAVVVSYHFHTP
jgi:hypothetical protein